MGCLWLRSIHQGRCPLTSVAIKGVHIGISIPCTVIPPIRGYHVETLWRCPLRSDGVPPTHWVAHQGRYHVHGGGQKDASSWGNPPDTYDNLLPAEEVIFQLSIDELGTQIANTKKFGTRYSICSKNFQIALIIMMQMTRFKEIFNFLVKVKWECATTHIPECT